jgi:RNA polymerase sigma-70 factor (ECF subfamily)
VLAAGRDRAPEADAALERLCRTYWYPLYAYVRQRGYSPHDAQDLTQEFFAKLLEKNYLNEVDPAKGKFRSFLLAALNHFLANEYDRATALKRGGRQTPISLDAEMAEGLFALEPVSNVTPEKVFERRWASTLLDKALAGLQEEYAKAGKEQLFGHLKMFLTEGAASGEYAPVAKKLHMAPGTVAVAVHRLRQRYRELVRAEVANTLANPAETEEEMRHLFSVLTS